eukprot:TRINITY_DN1349_c0_g1_i1.p1 TRINITY_DN1349_c0_g1~~TRINITY_DN1349_c0_g1_i1.p1  ORF type:complete len:881 (-),score=144.00 TRINITY_DN1349_c0_g1_i1:82-2571(-)
MIFFKKFNSTCTGGVEQPANIPNIPCEVECQNGEFYGPPSAPVCTPCDPGSYSSGGGLIFESWTVIPSDFVTSCTGTGCSPWSANGTFIESGNQGQNNNILSNLIYQPSLVHAGNVTFEYRVEAENYYDGLTFSIDGVIVMGLSSQVTTWTSVTFPILTKGPHTLTWTYKKDVSITVPSDHAMIRKIVITGVTWAALECTPCSPGHYADVSGLGECRVCPRDTYMPDYGAETCLPCGPDYYSDYGATVCMPRNACTANDRYIQYTPCTPVPGSEPTRTGTWVWKQPQTCLDTCAGCGLPPSTGPVPCEPCNPGFDRNTDAICVNCPIGYHRADAEADCTPCGAGTAAVPEMYYEYFNEPLPAEMSTQCFAEDPNECAHTGWTFAGDYVDSGTGHGRVDLYLNLNATIDVPGSISFNYSINCVSWSYCTLYFLIDGVAQSTVTYTRSATNRVVTFPLAPGNHAFTWHFYKPEVAHSGRHVTMDRIVIIGTHTGGAAECLPCNPGTFSTGPTSQCSLCEPGTSSAVRATSCTDCPPNSFAADPGSPMCYPCGPGTTAPAGHSTDCDDNDCSWTDDWGHKYDLSPLSRPEQDWGPFNDATRPGFQYYINFCTRYHNASMCRRKDGLPLSSFVCQLTETESFNLGEVQGFYPLPSDPTQGLVYLTTYGDQCNGNVSRTTNITLICDPEAGAGAPVSVRERNCYYEMTWRSYYACRVCTDLDYTSYDTCSQGTGLRSYTWNEPKTCFRGIPLPASIPWPEACASPEPQPSSSSSGLSQGAKVAIGFSCVFGLALAFIGFRMFRSKQARDAIIWGQDYRRMPEPMMETAPPESVN